MALHFLVFMFLGSVFLPPLNTGSPYVTVLACYRTLANLTLHRLYKSLCTGGL